ncbi:MAG: acylneuraminate cytidylyltransferase family protein [Actinomycetota bacterium]|nr:acylneuraminate cytidylyltransferase family protein [Actinomycetota bacterium]
MIDRRTAVGLIPARAGSKGIPGKNTIDVCGKPLIQWTIDAALGCRYLDRVLVSTDDPAVKATVASQNVDVLDRPSAISGDSATAAQVIAHALESAITEDILVYLQPTSPLRDAVDIDTSLEILTTTAVAAVVSVTEVSENPEWMYRMPTADSQLEPVMTSLRASPRQNLPRTVRLNGAIYSSASSALRPDGDFFRLALHGYAMSRNRSVDIDTPEDLALVRALLSERSH